MCYFYRPCYYITCLVALILIGAGVAPIIMRNDLETNVAQDSPLRSIFDGDVTPIILLICGILLVVAGVLLLLQSLISFWILNPKTSCCAASADKANQEMMWMVYGKDRTAYSSRKRRRRNTRRKRSMLKRPVMLRAWTTHSSRESNAGGRYHRHSKSSLSHKTSVKGHTSHIPIANPQNTDNYVTSLRRDYTSSPMTSSQSPTSDTSTSSTSDSRSYTSSPTSTSGMSPRSANLIITEDKSSGTSKYDESKTQSPSQAQTSSPKQMPPPAPQPNMFMYSPEVPRTMTDSVQCRQCVSDCGACKQRASYGIPPSAKIVECTRCCSRTADACVDVLLPPPTQERRAHQSRITPHPMGAVRYRRIAYAPPSKAHRTQPRPQPYRRDPMSRYYQQQPYHQQDQPRNQQTSWVRPPRGCTCYTVPCICQLT